MDHTSAAALSLSALSTVLAVRILEVAPGSTDLASAGVSTAFNVGITAGALIGGLLVAGPGLRSPVLVGALISVAALAATVAEPLLATSRRASGLTPAPRTFSRRAGLDRVEAAGGPSGAAVRQG